MAECLTYVRFEKKTPCLWSLFPLRSTRCSGYCPYTSHILVQNGFSLAPHHCKTDSHSGGGEPHYEFFGCTFWKNSIKVLLNPSPAWAACAWHGATLACWVCCYRHITLFAQGLCVHSISAPSCPSLARSQWIRAEGTVETGTWVLPQAVKRWRRRDGQTPRPSQEKDWLC